MSPQIDDPDPPAFAGDEAVALETGEHAAHHFARAADLVGDGLMGDFSSAPQRRSSAAGPAVGQAVEQHVPGSP